jgi:imidazolonepropionase-like amidohydrolase
VTGKLQRFRSKSRLSCLAENSFAEKLKITNNEKLANAPMKKLSIASAVIVAAIFCPAGKLAAQQHPARVAIHAARVLDVKTGKLLTDQTLLIEDGKIVSLGPAAQAKPPTDAVHIDLPSATVLPGLIDAHTHLTMDPKFGYEQLAISIPRETLIGAKNARLTLNAGFTTVRNVGARGYTDVALRDAINAGDVPGPRMLVSGPALSITGGHCDNDMLPFEYHAVADGVADGIAAVQQKVRQNIKYGSDLIKVCATGGVLSLGDNPQASQYTLEEMKAIVADAHRLGRKVAAHAHGAEGLRWATEAGVDSIEHGSYIDDAGIALMKEHGTYLVPTLYLGDWMFENMDQTRMPPPLMAKAREVIPMARKNIAHAFASGVKVAFGTDAAVYPHGLNAHEFAVMVKLGLTPLQAIQAATINAADLLGWSGKVGSLEPGAWADIIAVDGDPLQDVTTLEKVKFVMKGGEVVKNEYGK